MTTKNEDVIKESILAQQELASLRAQMTALERDKADSQTANATLREQLAELRIDMRSEQSMSYGLEQQLAASETAAYDVAGTIEVLKQQLAAMEESRNDHMIRWQAVTEQLRKMTLERDGLIDELFRVYKHEPKPDGTWDHALWCNGDRSKPPGTKGVTCNCRIIGLAASEHERDIAKTTRDLALQQLRDKDVKCMDLTYLLADSEARVKELEAERKN